MGNQYATIDYVYRGVDNAFGWGQSYMNVVENIGYLWALYQYRVKGNKKLGYIVWFGLLIATFSKTVLYALVEVGDSNKNVGHNPWGDFLFYYLFFNNVRQHVTSSACLSHCTAAGVDCGAVSLDLRCVWPNHLSRRQARRSTSRRRAHIDTQATRKGSARCARECWQRRR